MHGGIKGPSDAYLGRKCDVLTWQGAKLNRLHSMLVVIFDLDRLRTWELIGGGTSEEEFESWLIAKRAMVSAERTAWAAGKMHFSLANFLTEFEADLQF